MLITTTPTVEGQRVIHDRGLVTGEAIIGANQPRTAATPIHPAGIEK